MLPFSFQTLVLAFRSRFFLLAAVLGITLLVFAGFAAGFSPRQPQTIAMDVGISFIRLVLPILSILLAQELLMKEIERKMVFTMLAYPRGRSAYLFGRYTGIAILLFALLVFLSVVLAALLTAVGMSYEATTPVGIGLPYVISMFFTFWDTLLILAFVVWLTTFATSSGLIIFGGLAFMIIARAMGSLLFMLKHGNTAVDGADFYIQLLSKLRYVFPDLGLLDIRQIALYNDIALMPEPGWALILMPLAYLLIMLSLAARQFSRRQFN